MNIGHVLECDGNRNGHVTVSINSNQKAALRNESYPQKNKEKIK